MLKEFLAEVSIQRIVVRISRCGRSYRRSHIVDSSTMERRSLPLAAAVIGPKSMPVRASADKASAKLRSLPAGEEVTVLELQRTLSGTTRARIQCGWTTAQTKEGRRLLELDGACAGVNWCQRTYATIERRVTEPRPWQVTSRSS